MKQLKCWSIKIYHTTCLSEKQSYFPIYRFGLDFIDIWKYDHHNKYKNRVGQTSPLTRTTVLLID